MAGVAAYSRKTPKNTHTQSKKQKKKKKQEKKHVEEEGEIRKGERARASSSLGLCACF
jgi:hypothetical protein